MATRGEADGAAEGGVVLLGEVDVEAVVDRGREVFHCRRAILDFGCDGVRGAVCLPSRVAGAELWTILWRSDRGSFAGITPLSWLLARVPAWIVPGVLMPLRRPVQLLRPARSHASHAQFLDVFMALGLRRIRQHLATRSRWSAAFFSLCGSFIADGTPVYSDDCACLRAALNRAVPAVFVDS